MSEIKIADLARPNFAPLEFVESLTAQRLGLKNEPNKEQLVNGMKLADKMQELRNAIKKPFDITSGFRSKEVNKAVGGSPNSKHMDFLACDLNIAGMNPLEGVMAIKATKISVDKCFVERDCIHLQIQSDPSKNQNFFGNAAKINGKWVVSKLA